MDLKEWRRGLGPKILIASLLLCLACLGCVLSRTIADHALHAPNQQIKLPREFKQLDAALATNFPVRRIAVGPPPATLELMVLEPGDYDAKLTSTITPHHPQNRNDRNRYDFNFSFNFLNFHPKPKPGTNDLRGTIFLLHGYGLNKEIMLPWGLVLAQAGYRVVLVDLRGHGHSTGDRIYFGGVERTDLVQCLDTLVQRRVCEGPVGVLGISYGAVLALQWVAIDPRVQSVAAISPYPDPGTAVDRYLKTFAPNLTWRTDRKVAVLVASRLAEFPDLTTETAIRQVKHPILFVRGEQDEVCLREDLSRFQTVAPPGSELNEVPLADHLVVGMCISQLRNPVTEWFRNQLAR
jgi:pimeloyl-ACP methyl ester carboxylesterase